MSNAAANIADLFEIIRTTRSMRRLKPDPVPNELIRKILEAGVCAPSGGNMQRWRFLVIRDPKVKETVGALYKRAWDEQVAPRYRSGEPAPGTSRHRRRPRSVSTGGRPPAPSRFARDSPLEGSGFELSVPPQRARGLVVPISAKSDLQEEIQRAKPAPAGPRI
jgi:nitroreductase